MSELLNTLSGISQQFGKTEIAGLLITVALLLIWLLVRVVLRRSDEKAAAVGTSPQTMAQDRSEHRPSPDSALSKQAGRVAQAAAAEHKPAPAPAAESANSVVQPRADVAPASRVPQDSVLRRHYLAQMQAQKEALANPYPTDSVLRRHYEQSHKLVVEAVSAETPCAAQASGDSVPRAAQPSIVEQAVAKDSSAALDAAPSGCRLPQDSVLKRHFIARVQAEIETSLPPKPSDSVLRRHYENLVRCELENRLTAFNV